MTGAEFKTWLTTNNIGAEAYNIKNVDDLYNKNWYFTTITDKYSSTSSASLQQDLNYFLSNYLIFRLDFNADEPVYNYNGTADYTVGAQEYYQGESGLLGDYQDRPFFIDDLDGLAPDLNLKTANYKWSSFSAGVFTSLKTPSFFTQLDAESLAKINADARRVSDIKQVQIALELYYNDVGRYPEFVKFGQPFGYKTDVYMTKAPTNPTPGGKDYDYQVCGNGENYRLLYKLETKTGSIPAGDNVATPAGITGDSMKCVPKDYKAEDKNIKNDNTVICQDSDGGHQYNTKGRAIVDKGSQGSTQGDDICLANSGDQAGYASNLIEYYCDGLNIKSEKVKCPNGCKDGACQSGPIKTDLAPCRDSDGGKNYDKFGWVYKGVAISDHRKQDFTLDLRSDHCSNGQETPWSSGNYLVEYYCDNGSRKVDIHQCPNGCQAGRCLAKNEKKSTAKCIDPDGGNNYFQAGATFYNGGVNDGIIGSEDFCQIDQQGKAYLEEHNCDSMKQYVCPNGCADGVCLPDPNTKQPKTKTAEEPKSFSAKNAGRIFLQAEANGEAWYVSPKDFKRYYLQDGLSAYQALRQFGVGITNTDLAKIPVGLDERFKGDDTDSDGLDDKIEEALGTDPTKADSDDDSYNDGQEIGGGYNVLGSGKNPLNQTFANKLEGKIVLAVEGKGEAWYIYKGKRYYLPDGETAYNIMRYLSTGISNSDLEKMESGSLDLPTSDSPESNDSEIGFN
jgi:hypothetical protein